MPTTPHYKTQWKQFFITNSAPQFTTVEFARNPLKERANFASNWCNENATLLNTAKSSVITFTLMKEIHSEPIVLNNNQISEASSVKSMGMHYDKHLRFTNFVQAIISKSRPAYHAIVRPKRAWVSAHRLGMFYKSRVLSTLSYAAPAWFLYLADNDKEFLEKYQRLCFWLILPQLKNYDERLQQLNIDPMRITLDVCMSPIWKPYLTTPHTSCF